MSRDEQLKFCTVCKNRAFDPKYGTICANTNAVATFSGYCADYVEDEKEVQMERMYKHSLKQSANRTVNRGRYALFIVAGLYAIVGYLEGYVINGHQLIFGIIDWIVAGVFIGLGVWSFYKASLAMIIGLVFYTLIIVLLAIFDPITILQGIIWKVLVFSSLIYGIKTAREEEASTKTETVDLLDQI